MERISVSISDRFYKRSQSKVSFDAFEKENRAVFDRFSQEANKGELGFMSLLSRDNSDVSDAADWVLDRSPENFVILGIGGSSLGARAIKEALLHPEWNLLSREQRGGRPRVFILENIDPFVFESVIRTLDLEKTVFNVISKSGKTAETATQFLVVVDLLKKKLGDGWKEHLIITTDPKSNPKSGPLREFAEAEKIYSLPVPRDVGGRFSVLSPVGLLPAQVMGIDTDALLKGANKMADRCLGSPFVENPAFLLSAYYSISTLNGRTITVLMPYADRLKGFGLWFCQLWGESLGKVKKDGSSVGLTPVLALGATDQHSQLQLYLEGPPDKSFTLIEVEDYGAKVDIPPSFRHKDFEFLYNSTMESLIKAEFQATRRALTEYDRPNLTISLSEISPSTLGGLFVLYEAVTTIMGYLMEINPFDQPAVELGKKLAKEILTSGLEKDETHEKLIEISLD